MMEHAQPIEPVSSTSNEAVAKSTPRDSTDSLFSLHDEAMESGDLSFSNCSDKPSLTLVLPEDASQPADPEDADVDAALSIVDDEEFVSAGKPLVSLDDDAEDIETDEATALVPGPASAQHESAVPIELPPALIEPATGSSSSSIFSTTDLRPISRPSRFILPDEKPAAAAPATQFEIPKPIAPVVAPVTMPPLREPASVAPSAPESTPEKKSPPPVRVGSGQLQPTRLNWKPGEPFGDSQAAAKRFRWELMLTTACGTAACGLAGIWLLRTLLS